MKWRKFRMNRAFTGNNLFKKWLGVFSREEGMEAASSFVALGEVEKSTSPSTFLLLGFLSVALFTSHLARGEYAMVPRLKATKEEWAAAKGMEQLFVEQMVQELRKSVPENDLVPLSNGERIYRQMLDSEYSRMMTDSYNFGIAELVLAEIQGRK